MRKYDRQEDSLWKAAFDGNVSKVKTLARKFEPSKNRELFAEVLRCAVEKGHAPVVKALLAAGGNPNQTDAIGTPPLTNAAWQGHLNVVRVLVAAGAVVDRKVEGRTALEAALEFNRVEVADYLKKQGADWVMLTLLYACGRGDLAAVKNAIAAGASIHRSRGVSKETPLMRAAGGGHIHVVKHLLQLGADPNAQVEGRTALWHAAHGGSVEVIDALVEAGADVNDRCDDCTPLMAAATFAPLPVVRRLVELGADIAAIDGTGVDGVLDYARKGKKRDVVAYLSKLGTKSARGPARELANAIAHEFGGRPKPQVDGFFISSSLAGFRCRFRVGRPRCSVEISNLKVSDKDFRLGESAWLIIGSKPERRRGPCREVTKARQITGAPVYRSTDLGSIPEDAVLRFCKRHRRAFERLRLSETDEVWIGDTYAQFTWAQSGELRPWNRLKAFGALVREIAPLGRERKLFAREWLLKPAAKSGGRFAHQLGGRLEEPLCCPHCGAATNLMAQIDLADPLLPKTAFGPRRVPVFWCLDCQEWDETFFDISAQVPRPLDRTGKQIEPAELETGEGDLPERRVTLAPVAAGKEPGLKSKLGGEPEWIQMDQTPDCPKCEEPMAFVLQLASGSRVSFGDEGMLYAFACPDCQITGSLVQSY